MFDSQHHDIILVDVNWCGTGRGCYCIIDKCRWACDFCLQNMLLLLSLDNNLGLGPSIVTNLLGYYHHISSFYAPNEIYYKQFLYVYIIILLSHPIISTYSCNAMSKYPPLPLIYFQLWCSPRKHYMFLPPIYIIDHIHYFNIFFVRILQQIPWDMFHTN